MDKNKNLIGSTINFLKTDIWRIRANKLSGGKSFWIRQLRIVLLALRGFAEDKCQLRASALTFYSLLSVVPVVAMAFGIAKGFGFEKVLEKQLYERLPGQEEAISKIIGFSNILLKNTQGGLIAGIGIIILFWTVIKVLGNIESSFNEIWGIKKGRAFGRKFSDYLSIMLICPVLLITSSSMTVLITSQVKLVLEKLSFLGSVAPLIMTVFNLLPYAVLWILFTFIYIFMPNTKVNFKSGLFGGIIAGTVYQLAQWGYITFQVGASKYGAIYGSFAALPLFLVWLQLSWLIVLFGAEISFAEQNVETYEFEEDCLKASLSFKRLLTLSVVHLSVKNFHERKSPLTAQELSQYFEIPVRLIRQILFELTEARILAEVKINDSPSLGYQPAHDIDDLTLQNVIEQLDDQGIDTIPIAETKEVQTLNKYIDDIKKIIKNSPQNVLLKDL